MHKTSYKCFPFKNLVHVADCQSSLTAGGIKCCCIRLKSDVARVREAAC